MEFETVTDELWFPEGPIAMPDGSVLVVEIGGGRLTRVLPDGTKQTVAETGGGPNGAAIGPDGKVYICNNGGMACRRENGLFMPAGHPDNPISGRIQRVDIDSGSVETLYKDGDFGCRLSAPNDIVFDGAGGFWFTDLGSTEKRSRARTGVFYAKADGSALNEVIFPMDGPNGIGLSPDGRTVYVAETFPGNLWAFPLSAPGTLAPGVSSGDPARFLFRHNRYTMFDSLAVEANGNVCVATIVDGGISVVSSVGELVEFVANDDVYTTNICFGGDDMQTAWITSSSRGLLLKTRWPRPGLKLAY